MEEAKQEITKKGLKDLSWKAIIVICLAAAAVVIAAIALITGKISKGGPIENEYIKISKYKGVEVTSSVASEVTDKDIETYIKSDLETNSSINDVTDRACQVGDYVNVDYTGTIDGEAFDGGSATDTEIEITEDGAGYIDGFVSGIVGHKTGEEFDVSVTFPSDYGAEELSGKDAVFHFVLNKIYTRKAPELTDEYVKKNIDGCNTVKEYKEKVRKELEEQNTAGSEADIASQAWQAVLNNTKVIKYPEGEVEKVVEGYKATYEQYAKQYDLSFEDFLKQYLSTNEEEFKTQVQQAAEETIKQNLVVQAIAKAEGLELTDKEYDAKIKEMAKSYGYNSSEELLEAYKEQMTEQDFKDYILSEVVQKWVTDNAIVKTAKK